MSEATSTPTTRGLAALAAAIGDLEPPRVTDEVLPDHCDRLAILAHAAPRLPITSAADAALAVSAASLIVGDLDCLDLSEAEQRARRKDLERVLAQLGRWMAEDLNAPPLATVWPGDASPFARPALATEDRA